MTIAAISPLAGLMPAASDSATATNAPSDSGASFAAMLAGAHRPAAPARADAKDASAKDEAADDKDRKQATRSRGKVAAATTAPAVADPAAAGDTADAAATDDAAPAGQSASARPAVPPAADNSGTAADAMIAAASLIAGKDGGAGADAKPAVKGKAAMTAPTVDILAARTAGKAAASDAQPADPKKADDKSAGDDAATIDATVAATPDTGVLAAAGPAAPAKADDATAPKADAAGQTLAATGADRQADLARQGAWLDGLARDISATADNSGTVRFQVSPQSLGTVHVEMTRGDDGSSVKFTAATEAARTMLDDAKPQFIADARAHGIRINDAQVDVGGSRAGTDQQGGNHRQASAGMASNGAGASAQGQAGGQSQPRSGRIVPEYQLRNLSSDMTDSGDASTVVASTTQDARYA